MGDVKDHTVLLRDIRPVTKRDSRLTHPDPRAEVVGVDRGRFRTAVARAVETIPSPFRERLENVEIVVEDEPSDEQIRAVGLDPETATLFGLYEGTPLPEREHNYGMALPDRIFLFYGPLVDAFPSEAELTREIRVTIVHEVGHFFGLDDDEIEDLGY
jgi:predicted Zn-dependent protease with MMP-like domain